MQGSDVPKQPRRKPSALELEAVRLAELLEVALNAVEAAWDEGHAAAPDAENPYRGHGSDDLDADDDQS